MDKLPLSPEGERDRMIEAIKQLVSTGRGAALDHRHEDYTGRQEHGRCLKGSLESSPGRGCYSCSRIVPSCPYLGGQVVPQTR